MSVLYGLLYMFFSLILSSTKKAKGGQPQKLVSCLSLLVGVIASSLAAPFSKDYNRRAQEYRDRGELPPAELRLIPMMIGCWFVPAGLFAFAWSSYQRLSWPVRVSGFAVGFGFLLLYNPANNYIVDSYQHYAASALAAKTFVRSIWGACTSSLSRCTTDWATNGQPPLWHSSLSMLCHPIFVLHFRCKN